MTARCRKGHPRDVSVMRGGRTTCLVCQREAVARYKARTSQGRFVERAKTSSLAEAVREDLRYDPETGLFTRLRTSSANAVKGDAAGSRSVRGYHFLFLRGRRYRAHRLAFLYMTGEWPSQLVDHVNGDPSDNRWCNLRLATKAQNRTNSRVSKNSLSGIKGVSQKGNRWRARLGGRRYLGSFATKDAARAAYEAAAIEAYGEYRRRP